jgi:nitrite reductase/ring-hydroxylating ferredoxin subunit
MADDPQSRFEQDLALDARVDSPAREGLTGTAPTEIYERRDPNQLTLAPDGAPLEAQPKWRRDFAIDWPQDHYVARRDFAKFLVLTSGAFVVGQAWIAGQALLREREPPPPRARVASARELPPGAARVFHYPGEDDPCLLLRTPEGELLAYSQKCTHLSCAVVPRMEAGVLHCPCHEGYFDLRTGRNIAGPPPRPLPKIELEIDGGEVYAVGVVNRSV